MKVFWKKFAAKEDIGGDEWLAPPENGEGGADVILKLFSTVFMTSFNPAAEDCFATIEKDIEMNRENAAIKKRRFISYASC